MSYRNAQKVAYIQKKSIAIMHSIYRLYKKHNEKIYMAPHQEKLQCENATITLLGLFLQVGGINATIDML